MSDSELPRRRGRPRKHPEPVVDPNAPPRRRGRPRKHPLPPEGAVQPKRPRGRPRKNPLPEQTTANPPMAVKLAKSPEPSKAKRSTKPDAASAPSAPPVEAPVPQPAPAPAATHRPAVPTISPLSGAGLSAGEINRLRLIELHRALLSELDELNGGLDRAFESIRAELQEKAAELRRHLGCSIEEDTAPDEPWALHLSAQIEKLAQRLVIFRTASKPDADDLAALSTRLKKAARKLQR